MHVHMILDNIDILQKFKFWLTCNLSNYGRRANFVLNLKVYVEVIEIGDE